MLMDPCRQARLIWRTTSANKWVACIQQGVDVISRAIDRSSQPAHVADDAANVCVEFLTPRICNHAATSLIRKDDMVVQTQMSGWQGYADLPNRMNGAQ